MLRTHTCGDLTLADIGEKVTLCGWVQRIRDKGKVVWIDLRDRYGVTQLVLEEKNAPATLFTKVRELGREYVISAQGKVVKRIRPNPKLPTGEIEVRLGTLEILNIAHTPPFLIDDETDGHEALRMQYRYLDLRRPCLQRNLQLRQEITTLARDYLTKHRLIELETPILVRSTPEGARDFVVPSRNDLKRFYALPQSPQILKQLFMVAGMDRYFQFARCFRDEDLRADRQPEFTQLDCELSFVTQQDIRSLFEGLLKHLFLKVKHITLPDFPVLSHAEAMRSYGTDKPDLRFGMPLITLTETVRKVPCPLWPNPELVAAICVPGGANLSRKALDKINALAQQEMGRTAKMTYIKYTESECNSPLTKWYHQAQLQSWGEKASARPGDLLLLTGGTQAETQQMLGALRLQAIKAIALQPTCAFAPVWIVDFPLLAWHPKEQRYHAMHHPFTAPKPEEIALLQSDPARVSANAYDLVINGVEIGGGSIRIHDRALQEKVFTAIGIDSKTAKEQFGTLLSALEYGAPPHGGIAFGWDRLCLIMGGGNSIRDYIPFPKNNAGRDVMLGAPAPLFDPLP